MHAKIFSVEEARALLPRIGDIIHRMRELRARIMATRERITILETLWADYLRATDNPDSAEYEELRRRNRTHVRRFRIYAEELDRMGCHIKDLERGSVGFFHVREGQVVFLSWLVDDPSSQSFEEIASNARVFTLDEARELLPRLRSIFAEFDRIETEIAEARRELGMLEVLWGVRYLDENVPDADRVRDLTGRIRDLVAYGRQLERELRSTGCQLKDFQNGLIDFYHVREGNMVFLCWKRDEQDITAWHPLDGGYVGRRTLETDVGNSGQA